MLNPRHHLLALGAVLAVLAGLLLQPAPVLAATFVVTRQDDPSPDGCAVGDCSLREAIIAANTASDADVITLPAGTYTLTIAGPGEQAAATGDLDITNSVTINGTGAATTIVEAGPSAALAVDRVFDVRSGSLTISGLTVRNGNSSTVAGGGGISVLTGASLTVTDCTITQNQAGTNGGGILNSGTLMMSNSTVNSNVTATGGTAEQLGGGIATFNTGLMALNNVTVSGNIAGRQGGGVYNNAAGSTITGGSITGNSTPTGTTVGTRDGGGVYNSSTGTLTISGTSITSNTAGRDGGGIANSGTIAINNSTTISGNSTTTPDPMDPNVNDHSGGGIRNFSSGILTIQSSTISGNTAYRGGGGLAGSGDMQVTSSTVSSNQSGASGGGVSTFASSTATTKLVMTGGSVSQNASNSSGGGIGSSGLLQITNTAISGNQAATGGGGIAGFLSTVSGVTTRVELTGVTIGQNTAASASGGGVSAFGADLAISGSTIENNSTVSDGAGVATGSSTSGSFSHTSQSTIVNTQIRGNHGTTGNSDGGGISNSTGPMELRDSIVENNDVLGFGGGIGNFGGGVLTVFNATIRNNTATGGGGGITQNNLASTSLTLTDSTVSGNTTANGAGGGLIAGSGSVTLLRTTFSSNSSGTGGGGLSTSAGTTLNLTNSTLQSNTAGQSGGGLNSAGTATLTDSTVAGNHAASFAGGLNNIGTLTLNRVTVSGNASQSNGGGGISNGAASTLNVTDSTISGNTTQQSGGGITADSGATLNLVRTTISQNSATGTGGGLTFGRPASGGTGTLVNVTFGANTSGSSGGGLALFGPTLTSINVTFQGNQATQAGAVFVQSGVLNLKNTILANSTGGNCLGTVTSQGNNLEFPGNTCSLNPGLNDILNADPQLGQLANNGGSTLTHALSGNSPAVDAGTNSSCPSTDQRGASRPLDGNGDEAPICDIGAVEASGVLLTVNKSGSGSGSGTVVVTGSGITCGGDCQGQYAVGRTVILTATPAGAAFTGWSGACTGTGSCVLTMDVAKNVTASFQRENVGVSVAHGPVLTATLSARPTCGSIVQIVFGNAGVPFSNAIVTITAPAGGPSNQTTGFTYAPPPGTTSVSLMIQRVVQSGGATVSLIRFFDGCGEWQTFVGGGPGAFQ